MTEKELYNEYQKSNCKSFTDFLINKIGELKKELVEKGQHLGLTEREWGKDLGKQIHFKTQLATAKELLRQWVLTSNASGCDNINIVTDTEQFLNSEVENV